MRQPLIAPTTLPDGASKSIAYQAWVLDKQFDSITKAWERTGLSWPEWSANALTRINETENYAEGSLELMLSVWPRGRTGKTRLSFRIYPETLAAFQKLAQDNNGTIQGVIANCFAMEAAAGYEQSPKR
jgi:hypothetical protein